MRTKTKTPLFTKIIILIISLAVVAAAAYFSYVYIKQLNKEPVQEQGVNVVNYNPPTEEEKNAPTSNKKEENVTEAAKPTKDIPLTITASQISDGSYTIRAITNSIITTGNCTLTIKDTNGKTITTKESELYQLPSTTTCKGFSIPVSSLSLQKFVATITMVSGNKQGSASKEVTL